MPGIIPMKVIKVGTSAQTRIAQACDRCRSKKIRCDGFRPSCTQCSQVGFECKTSDKLSRRAFPRGYTESLEERVRSLEGEVKELKDLLDAKDEKIDMLSRMRSNSPSMNFASRRSSSIKSPTSSMGRVESTSASPVESYRMLQPQSLNEGESTESSYYSGTSGGRAFADALRLRIEDSGRSSPACQSEALFPTNRGKLIRPSRCPTSSFWKAPPRMNSDQMVNVYFQEWAPLFPVLHKPTFLVLYEQYVSNASTVQDSRDLAQLHLVFGIAAISSNSRIQYDADACERQWMTSLNSFVTETSLTSLQCLILAQIYCIQKGDYDKLLYYKSLAAGMCLRLGLHQSQQRYGLGSLTTETRKRVFWSFYTLDCFSAAMLGLPKSLKEQDISCEYPVDVDDEYITEKGFQPTLPGEFTKVSSALALFKGAKILSNVLDLNYPASVSHEVSLSQISDLDADLEDWFQHLPPHLKLAFEQERPSTNIISSRCPLLSFTYHFTRVMIHRPAICAPDAQISSSSLVILASSCKHIVQIIQLLDERNLTFSHCLNRSEVLLLTGLGLLFQSVDLGKESKLLKDNQRTVCSVIEILERSCAPGSQEFKTIGCSMLSIRRLHSNTEKRSESASSKKQIPISPISPMRTMNPSDTLHRRRASTTKLPDPKPSMIQIAESQEAKILRQAQKLQQNNMRSRQMLASSAHRHTITAADLQRLPVLTPGGSVSTGDLPAGLRSSLTPGSNMNLDYFSFTSNRNSPAGRTPNVPSMNLGEGDWDRLMESFSGERSGSSIAVPPSTAGDSQHWSPMQEIMNSPLDKPIKSKAFDSAVAWSPDAWNLPSERSAPPEKTARNLDRTGPQSVLSLSDESLTSGEDFSSIEFGSLEGEEMFKAFMQVGGGDEKAEATA